MSFTVSEMDRVSSGAFICSFPDCQATYNKQWKLEAHICKHTGQRPFECKHEGCGKAFYSKSHLSRHQITHTGERPFKCSEQGCMQGFTTNYNLNKHISRKHKQGVKLYTCTFEGCGKTFKKNNLLKVHECTHTLQLPYECSYEGCGRKFANPSKQKRHEKVHKGYPCTAEDCSFIGKTWSHLTKHRKEHKVKVQCDQCKKMFRDQWFLRQHQHVHLEERVVFHCPREGCERSYTTAFNLQSHILSFHQEERAFTCVHPGCGKVFAMKVGARPMCFAVFVTTYLFLTTLSNYLFYGLCQQQSLERHCVVHDPDRKKQKKPRPSRSLASRLSGFKASKTRPSEISESGESTHTVTSQSKSPKSQREQVMMLSEPVTEEQCIYTSEPPKYAQYTFSLGQPLISDNAEITLPQQLATNDRKTDPSDPLLMESVLTSHSETVNFGNTLLTQSQSNTSDDVFSQSTSAEHIGPSEPIESKTTVIQLLESMISDSPMIS